MRPFANKRPFGPFFGNVRVDDDIREIGVEDPDIYVEQFDEGLGRFRSGRVMGTVGTLKWRVRDGIAGGTTVSIEYSFHESQVEEEFEFRPSGRGTAMAQDTNWQATDVGDLGGPAGKLGELLEDRYELTFDFAELDAASHGHMGLTDYEFTYESLGERDEMLAARDR